MLPALSTCAFRRSMSSMMVSCSPPSRNTQGSSAVQRHLQRVYNWQLPAAGSSNQKARLSTIAGPNVGSGRNVPGPRYTSSWTPRLLPLQHLAHRSLPLITLGQLAFSSSHSPSSSSSLPKSPSPDQQNKRMADKAKRHEFLQANLRITHEPTNNRFMVYHQDLNALWPEDPARHTKEDAHLLYDIHVHDDNSESVNFTSTYCPPEFRGGTGISEFLVENGLDWAHQAGHVIEPEPGCWYVKKFLPWKGGSKVAVADQPTPGVAHL